MKNLLSFQSPPHSMWSRLALGLQDFNGISYISRYILGVHFGVYFKVFHYWISLFCPPPPDKNICEQKVSKLQCTVMAGIVLRPSGVLFIKTCFCRSRKSASQQNLLCPQFVRWNNDETEVKNISNGDILNRKLKDTWNEIWVLGDLVGTIHPPFVTKAPSGDSIDALSLLWDMILIEW